MLHPQCMSLPQEEEGYIMSVSDVMIWMENFRG